MHRKEGRLRTFIAAIFVALAALAPAQAGPGFFVGVDEDSASRFLSVYPAASDLRLGAYRLSVPWTPGQRELTAGQRREYDRLVGAATTNAMRVVPTVWSVGENAPRTRAAQDDFCTFARALLERYPAIHDVIVWNEPNKAHFWQPQFYEDETSAAPKEYVALLARCWDVLHAFRPDVNVAAPATSPRGNDRPNAPSNISHSPAAFVREMGAAYRASGRTRRIFDTVAHHAYGSNSRERPWRPHAGTQISQGDVAKMIDLYREAFAGTRQAVPGQCRPGGCVWIWLTEAGFESTVDEGKLPLYTGAETRVTLPDYAGGEPDELRPDTTSVPPDQATQILDAIRIASCQPYVQAWFNYLLADSPLLSGWQSGWLWADGTRKDSYPIARRVVADAVDGNVDCANVKSGPIASPDTTPPGRVQRGSARTVRGGIRLDWPDGLEADVMGYRVYRSTRRDGAFANARPGVVGRSTFTDRRVRSGTTYYYAVSAVDTMENEGPRSPVRCATAGAQRQRLAPARYAVARGRPLGPTSVARLRSDDGARVDVTALPRGPDYAVALVATVPVPACRRPLRALWLALDAAASRSATVALAIARPSGSWAGVGRGGALGVRERPFAARVLRPFASLSNRPSLRIRLRLTAARPFMARIDRFGALALQ